jgi:hypothetical protein
MSLDEWKTLAETIQALTTSLGLLAAGLWSYLLFVKRRQRFPRAELWHEVALIRRSPNHAILHVKATLRNIGDVLIRVIAAKVHVGRVLPLTDEAMTKLEEGCDLVVAGEPDIRWPTVGSRECPWSERPCEIEPGESDDFHIDIPIEAGSGLVEVYSYFQNEVKKGRDIGWRHTSFVHIDQLCSLGVDKGDPDNVKQKSF